MYRTENDLLGDLQVPAEAYYGIQTQRAILNFNISGAKLSHFPTMIKALAYVKWASAKTNFKLGLLSVELKDAIIKAANEVIEGKFDDQFPVDMIQGGAGTSVNMNINEVLANRALEILGYEKGDYKHCSPNDHVNLSQSTNDAYPTAMKLAIYQENMRVVQSLRALVEAFHKKAQEFRRVIKMGRTQLQDAVPMTLGQEFEAFAHTLEEEAERLEKSALVMLETNMGATAIGTGLNAVPGYSQLCAENLAKITGCPFKTAKNLIEATQDTGDFVTYSSHLKRLAIKLSKICNDLRLLSSGPRCGLFEIQLPPMQPGSSIMPGKVNPVIPEVVNQVCYRVMGNDVTVSFASEAGQLQLNVMEPVLVYAIMESMMLMQNAMNTLREQCIDGIIANEEHCRNMVFNSVGIVTALNPYIGYKNSTVIAKEALESGRGVYELVLEHQLLSKQELDEILDPVHMLAPKPIVNVQHQEDGQE